jgi:hypothetical protein
MWDWAEKQNGKTTPEGSSRTNDDPQMYFSRWAPSMPLLARRPAANRATFQYRRSELVMN